MNILLINHYAGSPRYGMEYRPYYLAREWVRLGHRVTIAAASYSHLRAEQPTVPGPVMEEEIDGIRYLWFRTPPYHGNGLGRVRNMLSFVRQLWFDAFRLAKECEPRLVIASSTYPLDMLPARRVARRYGARLVFELHDLWPLSPIELGQMSRRHPFIVLMQWAEDYAYRHADRVVSLLPRAVDHMCDRGMDPAKFRYIPNGIALDEWSSEEQPLSEECQSIFAKLRQERRFLLGYAGGHALSNALDTLIEAAKRLVGRPVHIVLVGKGVEKEHLQRKARDLGLDNVTFLPPVAKRQMPRLLHEFDACYLGWARSPLYRFGICPNKLLDYMMSGKPVIHAIEAANDLVAESDCGISIPPEDPQAIADAVLSLIDRTPDEREAMGHRGTEYVMQHHDYARLAVQFLEAVS